MSVADGQNLSWSVVPSKEISGIFEVVPLSHSTVCYKASHHILSF